MLTEYIKQFGEKGEIYLRIKARPGAAATEVRGVLSGEEGETLKIDVAAAPENGKANIELVKFLAEWFAVGKASVKIISGAGEKIKLVKIVK